MWFKWFPWRLLVRYLARAQGFLDPFLIFAQLQRFAQPSKLAVPIELLRLATILHARGLMNSQAIQHNLDWVWPYWVECQFNPRNKAFVPRAFSLTHINLTHRNWTAVGMPDCPEYALIDPRGLVTPFYDGWSLDAWVLSEGGNALIPSRVTDVLQHMVTSGNIAVVTESRDQNSKLTSRVETIESQKVPFCRIKLSALSSVPALLVISARPYNPEGVSFIHRIQVSEDGRGWKINEKHNLYFNKQPDEHAFSEYKRGDVFHRVNFEAGGKAGIQSSLDPGLRRGDRTVGDSSGIKCEVGMATGAAIFKMSPGVLKECTIEIPLSNDSDGWLRPHSDISASTKWKDHLQGVCRLKIPDARFQMLYESAIRTLVLHSPGEIYPGPYTYKHFWFRDAAFIIDALLCCGLHRRAEKTLDQFPRRQTPFGYFHSQEGEWDSNGQALWIMNQYCRLTHTKPKAEWKTSIKRGGKWIQHKRLRDDLGGASAGLFPPGFSAEHLGPIDYYYWDDFWGVSGLKSAAMLMNGYGDHEVAEEFSVEAARFMNAIVRSLDYVTNETRVQAIPAAPGRRMDTGAIGSIVASYPLQLLSGNDPRILETIRYLVQECFVEGGFFHNMSHSGINPYLTLQIAQVLLRAGDKQYWEILKGVADLASPTGQWPEAIHPGTKGGCMGDGQHVWASAEWVLMIRNCFVREEGEDQLILCSGIPALWLEDTSEIFFGPTLTAFGPVSVRLKHMDGKRLVSWEATWHRTPRIVIQLPDRELIYPSATEHQVVL